MFLIKTLVISKRHNLQELLKELKELKELEQSDFQYCTFLALADIVEATKKENYQIAILDLALLGQNILEIISQINRNNTKTLIWALADQTNLNSIENIIKDIDDYLVWPTDIQNLKLKFLVARKQLAKSAELAKVQESLSKSEEKLNLALEIANGSWWEWNCVTGEANTNSHFGFDASEFDSYNKIKDKIHVEGKVQAEESLWKQIKENKDGFRDLEYKMQTKDGQLRWVSANGKAVEWDEEGNPVRLIGVSLDITKYKNIEKTLKRSEDNLKRAQAVSQTGSWYFDVSNNKLEWSDETYRMFGVPQNTPLDLDAFLSCVHPDDKEPVMAAWRDALSGVIYDTEHRIIVGDKIKWVRERAEVIFNEEGNPIIGVGTVQDITSYKEIQCRLQQFLTFFQISLDLGCIVDSDGLLKEINPSFVKVLGYSKEEILEKSLIDFVFAKDRQPTLEKKEALLQGNEIINFENRYVCKDGSIKWLSWNSIKDNEGLVYATARDITETKKAEEERQKLISLIERSRDFIGVANLDGKVTYLNSSGLKMVGLENIEQARKYKVFDFFPESTLEQIKDEMFPAIVNSGFWFNESKFKHFKTDETIDVELAAFTIEDPIKKAPMWLATITRDITERKRSEEALRINQQQLSIIYENVKGIIFYLKVENNNTFRFISVNQAFLDSTGLEKEKVIDKLVNEIIPQPSLDLVLSKYNEAIRTKQTVYWEETTTYPTGLKYGQVTVNPVFDANENATHLIGIVHDLTERKLAEETLQLSEEKFRSIIYHSPIGKTIVAPDGRLLDSNPAFCKISGYTKQELLAMDFKSITHPDDVEISLYYYNKLLNKEFESYQLEKRYIHKDGHVIWAELTTSLIWGKDNQPLYCFSQIQDITQRKRSEESLRESEARLKQAIKVSGIGIFEHDHIKDIIYWSPERQDAYNWGDQQPTTLANTYQFFHPDDREMVIEGIKQAHDPKGSGLFESEHRIVTLKGDIRWVSVRSQTFFGGEAEKRYPVRTIGAVSDLTERKQMEQSLRESEERYRVIIEGAKEGIIFVEIDSMKFIYVNPALCEMFDYSEREFLKLTIADLADEKNLSRALMEAEALIKGEKSIVLDMPCKRKDSTIFYVDINTSSLKLKGKSYLVVFFTDITKRRESAAEQARLISILEASPLFAGSADLNGNIIYINKALCKLMGVNTKELSKYNIKDFHPTWAYELVSNEGIPTALREGVWFGENAFINYQGVEIPIYQTIVAHYDEYGEISYLSTIASDISETKRYALLMEQTQNAAQIGGWELDCTANELHWTLETYYIHELEPHKYTPNIETALHFYPPKSLPVILEAIEMAVNYGQDFDLELEFITSKHHQIWVKVIGKTIRKNGRTTKVYGSIQNITARRQMENKLRESEERNRSIVAALAEGIVLQNSTGEILESNPSAEQILGLSHEQITGRNSIDPRWQAIHEDGSPFPGETHPAMITLKTGLPRANVIMGVYKPNGILSWISINTQPLVKVGETNPYGVVSSFSDITERKRAEETMVASLKEKDAMLKEIHHRVKNNLQIINSLLNLQSSQVKDAAVIAAFTETKNRIRSMALLHETLYKSENFAGIDLPSYVNSLCAHLFRSYGTRGNIKLDINIAEIELDLDRAIPIGLIINELVSNALKYAFVGDVNGIIEVKLLRLVDRIVLKVGDNGKGFSKEIDLKNTESLGLSLVCDLTSQLKGSIDFNNINGTNFNIQFPY